jgi:hypothetical protein
LLFRYPALRAEGEGLDPDLFGQSENRALFEIWIGQPEAGESFERALTPDLRPQYEHLTSLSLPAFDDDSAVTALQSAVWNIEQQRLRLAKRMSTAVLTEIGTRDSTEIADKARTAWETGATSYTAEDEADPAAAFVEDMEAGLKVHQRLLDQRSAGRNARRGGE